MRISFAVVDVFASRPLTGNPLALVPDAEGLPDDVMRAVAREFNQSETTFLLPPALPGADRRLRSFTPTGEEVGGAGHNSLGAWLWLAESGAVGPGGHTQEIGGRVLPVRVGRTPGGQARVSLSQAAPRFGATVFDPAALASALGLVDSDLEGGPAQVVDTGAGHLMVPVRDRAAVDRAQPDAQRLTAVVRAAGGEGVYVFSVEEAPDGAAAYARFFNPAMGIREDPATGTAAGPLAALLVERELSPEGTLHIEQGHALGRPSRLSVTVAGPEVTLSGTGLTVAEGTLLL
ncbi:PhzF family phenazine biosynthesis protein [Streptomyces fuscigenes]|uniref:PhzF family phenazine biosynthesis protein n=1 Tax=Streptomyces fuscigenes TaxID=1528880 RepID=UPI001F2BB406|nr:PhzF family phenazine biosynthesis protein [Streptomyces fuscigenes]MCF3961218.1 PhzF family phenazine biosynthesis protein [Streptomyces fuscigenes]